MALSSWARALLPVVLVSLPAAAGPLTVSSYSMYNGATGEYDYRDFTYTPCNSVCDVTSAFLSGGTGKLTDGESPALSWYQYGRFTPYVGWFSGYDGGANPTVTFDFADTVTVDSVTVWVDNSDGAGGVGLPGSVSIDGQNFTIAPDTDPDPRGYTFAVSPITADSVDVQFFQGDYSWIMVGEVSFDGSGGTAVPEPAAWALMAGGIACMWLRRRSSLRK